MQFYFLPIALVVSGCGSIDFVDPGQETQTLPRSYAAQTVELQTRGVQKEVLPAPGLQNDSTSHSPETPAPDGIREQEKLDSKGTIEEAVPSVATVPDASALRQDHQGELRPTSLLQQLALDTGIDPAELEELQRSTKNLIRSGLPEPTTKQQLSEQIHAQVLVAAGWEYVMPQPKSKKAGWGNSDERTTWWVGFWVNRDTNATSASPPRLEAGNWSGDGRGGRRWERGGAPRRPTKLEWWCSRFGGVSPR